MLTGGWWPTEEGKFSQACHPKPAEENGEQVYGVSAFVTSDRVFTYQIELLRGCLAATSLGELLKMTGFAPMQASDVHRHLVFLLPHGSRRATPTCEPHPQQPCVCAVLCLFEIDSGL